LRVHLVVDGTGGQLETELDATPVTVLTRTANFGTVPAGRVQLGNYEAHRTYDVAFDDVLVEVPSPSDTAPPSVPQGVTATAVGPTEVELAWTGSTDDTGVTGY